MKKFSFFLMALLVSTTLNSQVTNDDSPKKGIWDFKPEKIWEVDKAGNDEFGIVAELLVPASKSDQGNIYMRDFEHNISYIFDGGGRFLGSFAKQGSGKEEVSRYLNRFCAGDKIVLATPEKLHFYSEDGEYVKSVENNIFFRFPLIFLDENEFVYAPTLPQSPVNQKKLMLFDLNSGKEKPVLYFSEPKKADELSSPAPMIMIFGLTPQVRLAADKDKIYFGRSDRYTLYVADLKGNMDFFFSLSRQTKRVSPEDKKNHFVGSKIPQDRIDSIIKQLPDKMTYFSQITIVNGLIYVYAVDNIEKTQKQQTIDIFSDTGKYLYRGVLKFGENLKFGSPSNLVLHKNFAYVILESNEGRQTLAKYRISHPPFSSGSSQT
jgi:hypothetical protein